MADEMTKGELGARLQTILAAHDPAAPRTSAEKLRDLWLQYEPKSMDVIKAELRDQQETVGIPVPIL